MSQISPPIRILLVCALAFMGVYMTVLRPKDEVIPPADPAPNVQTGQPAVSQPGKVAEAAQGAVDAANGQLAQQESVDGVDAGETAAGTQTQTKPATRDSQSDVAAAGVDLNGVPKSIARAIRKDKTLVLLFWNGKSADDKAVHKALADVNRWHGRVFVASAPIKQISAYGRIARGVDVEQSPTIVVADSDLRAETLVGYVDAETIDQAVVDAFRNTTGIFADPYLKKVDAVCVHNGNLLAAIPTGFANADSAAGVKKDLDGRLKRFNSKARGFVSDFKAIKAPKKWAAFKRASLADLNVIVDATAQASSTLTPKSSLGDIVAAGQRYESAIKTSNKRQAKRFDRENLFRCGSQF